MIHKGNCFKKDAYKSLSFYGIHQNDKVVNSLMSELVSYKNSNKKKKYEPLSYSIWKKKDTVLLPVPYGASKGSCHYLKKQANELICHGIQNEVEVETCATAVLEKIEKEFPDSFMKVAKAKNYATDVLKDGKLDSILWNAMTEEANLTTSQGRTICCYLSYCFGTSIVVPESKRRIEYGTNETVEFKSFEKVISKKIQSILIVLLIHVFCFTCKLTNYFKMLQM